MIPIQPFIPGLENNKLGWDKKVGEEVVNGEDVLIARIKTRALCSACEYQRNAEECHKLACSPRARKDCKNVYFKKVKNKER